MKALRQKKLTELTLDDIALELTVAELQLKDAQEALALGKALDGEQVNIVEDSADKELEELLDRVCGGNIERLQRSVKQLKKNVVRLEHDVADLRSKIRTRVTQWDTMRTVGIANVEKQRQPQVRGRVQCVCVCVCVLAGVVFLTGRAVLVCVRVCAVRGCT